MLLENFRPGVMSRLGYSWDEVRALTPGIVYCSISGFGQTGPMSQRPAYDQIVQGLSGMMSITGTEQTVPQRVGFPICDTVGGLVAAMSINAALLKKERTGEGTYLDVSMLEASLSAMGWAVSNYLVSGVEPGPMGDQNATAAPSGTFHAADGHLNIAANRQEQFETLCQLIGRPGLVTDSRFAMREDRKANRDALNKEINEGLASDTAAAWEEKLSAHGVPAARVFTVAQAVELEQLRHREFFSEVEMPGEPSRQVRVMGSGVQVDGGLAQAEPSRPAPGRAQQRRTTRPRQPRREAELMEPRGLVGDVHHADRTRRHRALGHARAGPDRQRLVRRDDLAHGARRATGSPAQPPSSRPPSSRRRTTARRRRRSPSPAWPSRAAWASTVRWRAR